MQMVFHAFRVHQCGKRLGHGLRIVVVAAHPKLEGPLPLMPPARAPAFMAVVWHASQWGINGPR